MNKLKDFFYNFSDIILVLLVVVVASGIIYSRIDKIMAYPKSLTTAANVEAPKETENTADPKNAPDSEGTKKTSDPSTTSKTPTGLSADGTTFTIIIPQGSVCSQIADILKEQGLIAQNNDFINAVKILGVESKLKAGTFYIPKGSSPEQIVKIMTNLK